MAKKEKSKENTSKTLFGEPEKVIEESSAKNSAPGLFDYVNMLFNNPEKFSKLMSYEKSKNFFMMQRFFAIRFPIQAAMLNNRNINSGEAVQYWCDELSKKYKSTPGWIFSALKDVKKTKQVEKKKLDVKESTVEYYCKKNQCSKREVNEAFDIYGDAFVEELKLLEKMIS
jgi:hypothetical protein